MELVAPRVALAARVSESDWLGISDADLDRWLAAAHRLDVRLSAAGASEAPRWIDRARRAGTALAIEVDGPTVEDAVDLALAVGASDVLLGLTPRPEVPPLHAYRLLAARLAAAGLDTPLVLIDDPRARGIDPLLGPSTMLGALLCDGLGDSVRIDGVGADEARRLGFGVLQAARVRITRTEFISCPSCGRTLFDLEETTERIRVRTAHLKGVKIAIMGCIVNGPGEMADADFGYVGWGEEKIALFVGKEMVAKDIPTSEADERLVELIKAHGRWVEPTVAV
jgi:(E)-4-hydroxy-3-methylbut-2-enyl-diphosphate synthase